MTLETTVVAVFVLALARTSSWVLASPLFSAFGIPATARIGVAVSLALFTAAATPAAAVPVELGPFVAVLAGQVALGLILGWFSGLALAVFQGAGSLIDLSSGFAADAILDPRTGTQNALMARMFGLIFMALFFATNAHLTVVGGFVRTFDAVPPTSMPFLGLSSVSAAAGAVSALLISAVEIAAPTIGALLLTEVALAMASRFAPQANVFMIGMSLKVIVTLAAVGFTLVYLPGQVETVIGETARLTSRMGG
jgi:flagellar biosynthesis protein FliR